MKLAVAAMAMIGIIIGLSLPVPRAAPAPSPIAGVLPVPSASAPKVAPAPPPPPPPPPVDNPTETVLDRTPNGHFLAIADVNNEPVRFVVDTGADTVALTMEDARRAHVDFDPTQFQVIGRGAGGDVRGQMVRIADIVLDGKRASDVSAVVMETGSISLLGHSYLRHIGNVQISGDQMRLR